jgi:hypothetical protein
MRVSECEALVACQNGSISAACMHAHMCAGRHARMHVMQAANAACCVGEFFPRALPHLARFILGCPIAQHDTLLGKSTCHAVLGTCHAVLSKSLSSQQFAALWQPPRRLYRRSFFAVGRSPAPLSNSPQEMHQLSLLLRPLTRGGLLRHLQLPPRVGACRISRTFVLLCETRWHLHARQTRLLSSGMTHTCGCWYATLLMECLVVAPR